MHMHHHPFARHHRHPFFEDSDDAMYHAGRHGGHHDRGFGGDDGFRGGRHGGRFRGGRVFAHGELRLVLLALIAEQPRHGYELIRTIEEMFDGNYAPSPGAVYPTLTMLEEMNYASIEEGDGGKKRYAITEHGRAFLDDNRVAVDAAMARMEQTSKMYARMAAPAAIREAVHTLRHALHAHAWTAAEARRVVTIIKRAAKEIVDGAPGD